MENSSNPDSSLPTTSEWFIALDNEDTAFLESIFNQEDSQGISDDNPEKTCKKHEDDVKQALEGFYEHVVTWDSDIDLLPKRVFNAFSRASISTYGEAISAPVMSIPYFGDLGKLIFEQCLNKCATLAPTYSNLPKDIVEALAPLSQYENLLWGPLGFLHYVDGANPSCVYPENAAVSNTFRPKQPNRLPSALIELERLFKNAQELKNEHRKLQQDSEQPDATEEMTADGLVNILDMPIADLPFEPPIKRLLKRGGYNTARELADATDEDLMGIRGFGIKKLETVRNVIRRPSISPLKARPISPQAEKLAQGSWAALKDLGIEAPPQPYYAWAYPCAQAMIDLGIHDALRLAKLLESLDLPRKTYSSAIALDTWLDYLEKEGEREEKILLAKILGDTYEEIGLAHGITRERVRQITIYALKHRPKIQEDKFERLIQNYSIDQHAFCEALDEPPTTYNYLKLICDQKEESTLSPLHESLGDGELDVSTRALLSEYLDSQFIKVGSMRVKPSKPEILEAIIMSEAKESPRTLSELLNTYEQVLVENNLVDKSLRFSNGRALGAYLDRKDYAIKSRFGYRAYDFSYSNVVRLSSEIDFQRYWNMEISASLIKSDYQDLMEELDIRDAYELHSCLRLLQGRWSDPNLRDLKFNRSPYIQIGPDASRDNQVVNLIRELAPISIHAYAEEYSRRYGAEPNSFVADLKQTYSGFLCGDVVLAPKKVEMTLRDKCFIADSIIHGIRGMRNIGRRFRSMHSSSKDVQHFLGVLTPASLEESEFKLEGDCVFLQDEDPIQVVGTLLDRDEFSESDFEPELWQSKVFRLALQKLLRSHAVLSMGDGNYYSSKYLGITRDDCRTFIDAAIKFAQKDEPFNTHSLRKDGFDSYLLRAELPNRAFDELLACNNKIKRTTIGSTRVFQINSDSLSLVDVITWIAKREGALSLEELNKRISDYFGTQAKMVNLRTAAQKTGWFFPHLDSVVPPSNFSN